MQQKSSKLRPSWEHLAFVMFINGIRAVDRKRASRYLLRRPWRWVPTWRWRRLREFHRFWDYWLREMALSVSSRSSFHQTLRDHFALPFVEEALRPNQAFRWLPAQFAWLANDTNRRIALVERLDVSSQAFPALNALVNLYRSEAFRQSCSIVCGRIEVVYLFNCWPSEWRPWINGDNCAGLRGGRAELTATLPVFNSKLSIQKSTLPPPDPPHPAPHSSPAPPLTQH